MGEQSYLVLSRRQATLVVRHWKETMSKTGEKTKAMAAQLKVMKVEVNKSKQLNWLRVGKQ